MKSDLITIGFDKNGESDFGVNCSITELTIEQLNELRQMIPVAIYTAENMWRRFNPGEPPEENK